MEAESIQMEEAKMVEEVTLETAVDLLNKSGDKEKFVAFLADRQMSLGKLKV